MKKHHKKFISAKLILCVVFATSGIAPLVNASSLANVYDRLSNSAINRSATHYIGFTTYQPMDADDYFDVGLPAGFGSSTDLLNVACPPSSNPALLNDGMTVRCTATGLLPPGPYNVVIANIMNPQSVGAYLLTIGTHDSFGSLKEYLDIYVAITDRVNMSASVPSSMQFNIAEVATDTPVNGVTTTFSSATSSLDFGRLNFGSSSIVAQQLSVMTNARWGFVVTVEQDQDLTAAGGATIHPFRDGLASVVAENWTAPSAILDATTTYGQLGVTTDDPTLTANNFGLDQWKGFSGNTPLEVMAHNGPTNGTVQGSGSTTVGYRIEISSLQEAGDYYNTLTYICTPTY